MRTLATLVEHYANDMVDTPVPFLTAETIVGGIYEVVYTRVLRGATAELPALLPDLAYSVMLPYLGQPAAIEERQLMLKGPTATG